MSIQREATAVLIQDYVQDELILSDPEYDLSREAQVVLVSACAKGNTSLIISLLDLGVEPSDDCLLQAITYDRRDIVQLLLDDGRVNPSAADNYSLKIATERLDTDTIQLLIEKQDE